MMIKPSMHNYEECRSYIKRLSDTASLKIEYKYVYLYVCITIYDMYEIVARNIITEQLSYQI